MTLLRNVRTGSEPEVPEDAEHDGVRFDNEAGDEILKPVPAEC
jgi:hypothetical protein